MDKANEIKSSISPIPNITTILGGVEPNFLLQQIPFLIPLYGGHQYFPQLPLNRGKIDLPHYTTPISTVGRIPCSSAAMDMPPPRLQFTEPVIAAASSTCRSH
jgi:hypothetical protein